MGENATCFNWISLLVEFSLLWIICSHVFPVYLLDLRVDAFFGSFRDVHPQVFSSANMFPQMPLFLLYRTYGLICPSFTLWLFLSLYLWNSAYSAVLDKWSLQFPISFHFMCLLDFIPLFILKLIYITFHSYLVWDMLFILFIHLMSYPNSYIYYLCLAFFPCLKDMKWLYI